MQAPAQVRSILLLSLFIYFQGLKTKTLWAQTRLIGIIFYLKIFQKVLCLSAAHFYLHFGISTQLSV